MKYTKYLMAVAAFFIAASCATTDIDEVVNIGAGGTGVGKDKVQVHCRVVQYEDCDVNTRSDKSATEANVSSMALALFPIEDGALGNCAYYDYKEGSNIVFVIDRAKDFAGDQYVGKQYAMYVFANMHNCTGFPTTEDDAKGKPITTFVQSYQTVSANIVEVPEGGFPMIGSLGDYVSKNGDELLADGKYFILKPAASDTNTDGLPEVDHDGAGAGVGYVPNDNLEIPMKALYAKVSFTIKVVPDQDIADNAAPRFDLLSYQVNNIAKTVDLDSTTNSESDVLLTSNEYKPTDVYAQGATTATFTFYLPERFLTPTTLAENYAYPFKQAPGTYDETIDKDQNGIRDQDENLRQRFKGKLVDGKAATYITITGKFCDHQEHTYDVSYNIHLGGDNYSNFDLIRNTHYENTVTIRGIQNSSDQATNTNGIAIDHRVNVKRSTLLVVNLRRETLLDAHFEVRPMRLRLVGENIPTGTSATVTILNEGGTTNNLPGWIRMEKSGTGNDYIDSGVSAGKRKYFTTDLVTNTLAGNTSITLNNLTGENQTLWIYIDENTGTKSRAAIVRISHQGVDTDYKIVQNGLFEVKGADSGNTYYIEQYEEYLYNYDAEDNYGQTKDEGMAWGLDDVQLSKEHNSFYIDEDNEDWNNYVANNALLKYDFYIAKYDSFVSDGVTVHGFAGQHFTNEIFENSNGNVKVLTMDQQPSGAVEYCYNRNKRNSDGSIAKVDWYLPSADELEDFIVPAYASFKEFQNNYYWTSQPAFIRSAFYYQYATGGKNSDGTYNYVTDAYAFVAYEDNKNYARATKVVAKGNDKFDYVLSGLNKIPTDAHNMDADCINKNEILLDDSYFNVMYAWYRWNAGTAPETWTQDTHYNEMKNGSSTGVRYHVHVGHSFDKMYQVDANGDHGYHPRTKKNRVRCVRRDWNPDKTYGAQLVYTVSIEDDAATELDTSGNTMYVMQNTSTGDYLTTSGTYVAANGSTVGIDNLVTIEGKKLKSVDKNLYFNGYNGNVSFNSSGTDYSITNNSGVFTISYSRYVIFQGTTTYYLKQADDSTTVQMSSGSGNTSWKFYALKELKKEYVVVE